ncbi:ribonucleotide reductase N-terminal alpha domain-containing protein, partial [Oenococcus oeni]
MAAYKFYTQYAIKTDDGNYYVESYEDRITVNALYYADGDQKLAMRIADEMIHQRFQ